MSLLQASCRTAWKWAPLPLPVRRNAKSFLFRHLPWLFRALPAYQRWRLFQADAHRQRSVSDASAARAPVGVGDAATVRAIAMYLPQFHQIPENDLWWGKGFSEWTNVRRARPMYAGHHQPAIPHADIGYYDLADESVLERQAALARAHGIQGFCFYYYWFNGRRLLEKPLDRMLKSGRPDFPFCICWANENWTRNWDGLDQEVLIASRDADDDDERFIRDLLPLLRDPRYIRVEGRPIVIVYRVGKLQNPRQTAATWRRICREEGVGEIHLCSVWSFDRADPRGLGFDSAMQFPPLLVPCENLVDDRAAAVRPAPGFAGAILDYRAAVQAGLGDLPAAFPVFRGVMPAWDNTARRLERSTSWIHSSPEAYGKWLCGAVARTCREQPPSRRLVFINAWNEWAEGAYLEPDERHGYRRLEETRAALAGAHDPAHAADEPGLPSPFGRRIGAPWSASAATCIDATSTEFNRVLAESRSNILCDLFFCQPGFHGAGEYGKAVFRALAERAAHSQEPLTGLRIWAAFDPHTFVEPWIWDLCKAAGVPIFPVTSFAAIAALVENGHFDTFFTPGLVSYMGLFDQPRPSTPLPGAARAGRRTRVIGAIHDIIEVTMERRLKGMASPTTSPGPAFQRSRADYARLFASERIDTIVTVSEHSRAEMLDAFGPPAADLVVLAPAAKRRPRPEPFAIGTKPLVGRNFALIVNAGRPEKNAAAAVEAFDRLFSEPGSIGPLDQLAVVVSGIDEIGDLGLTHLRNPRRFIAIPQVAAGHFEFLLQQARFLVYPSLEEGFGYPPVEAMHYGTPSVVSRAGALVEVCDDAAVYCDPTDVTSIQNAIRRLCLQPLSGDVIERRRRHVSALQQRDLGLLLDLITTAAGDDDDAPRSPPVYASFEKTGS